MRSLLCIYSALIADNSFIGRAMYTASIRRDMTVDHNHSITGIISALIGATWQTNFLQIFGVCPADNLPANFALNDWHNISTHSAPLLQFNKLSIVDCGILTKDPAIFKLRILPVLIH